MSKQSDDKNENATAKKDVAVPADAASSKNKEVKGKGEVSKSVEPQAVAKDSGKNTDASEKVSVKPDAAREKDAKQDAKAESVESPNEKSSTKKIESPSKSEESKKDQTGRKAPEEEDAASPSETNKAEASKEVQNNETAKTVDKNVSEIKSSESRTEKPVAKTEAPKADTAKRAVTESSVSKSSDKVDEGVKKEAESKSKDAVSVDAKNVTNSTASDSGPVKSAIKDQLSSKRDEMMQEISARRNTAQGDVVGKEPEVSIKDLQQSADEIDHDSEDSDELIPVPAQNIFPENMPVRNLSGLLEPTVPPTGDKVETYAAVAAAAEQSHYDSAQDVISSVQNILKPKGEFLSRAELLEASKQLKKVMPYNFEAWRLHADILLNALRQLETRQLLPDESFQILAIPLRENDIRDAAESALRQCAHFAPNEHQRIRLVDEANSVRRITLF